MNFNAAFILSITLVILVVEIESKKGKHHGKGGKKGRGKKGGKHKNRRTVNPQDIHADYQKMLRDVRTQMSHVMHDLETCETDLENILETYEDTSGNHHSDDDAMCDEKMEGLKKLYQSSYVSQSKIVEKQEAEIKSLKKQLLKTQRSGLDTIINDLESRNQNLVSENENLESEKTLKDETIEELNSSLKLASQYNECISVGAAPEKILKANRLPRWKNIKTPKNGVVTVTWKVNDAGRFLPGVDIKTVNEWVSSIMCMLMSVTKVNLVEATSFERADIPISFLDQTKYRALNEHANSIAFSDSDQMLNSTKPTAPVYFNIQSKCARWRSMNQDIYLSQPDMTELVHMKYYLAHEIIHSLGLPHYQSPSSIMYVKPTVKSNYIFKSVFTEFNSDNLFSYDQSVLR